MDKEGSLSFSLSHHFNFAEGGPSKKAHSSMCPLLPYSYIHCDQESLQPQPHLTFMRTIFSNYNCRLWLRAAQNLYRLNSQTPLLSLAQNLNAYQVLGPSVNILPHPKKHEYAVPRTFSEGSKTTFGLLGM